MSRTGRRRFVVERWLSFFGDVRPGEGGLCALLGLQVFLLLAAYYLLKTVREPLVLLSGFWGLKGSELRTYGAAAQALLLLGVLPIYARFAGGIARTLLIRASLFLLVISLGVFIAAGVSGLAIGVPFFIWLGIVSLLSVAQFWSLAADLLDHRSGERLFGIIAVGGSLGAIVGAQLARWLVGPLGVYGLMGVAAGVYACGVPIVSAVEHLWQRRRAHLEGQARPEAAHAPEPTIPHLRGALALVLRDRYLLLVGVVLLLANLVNTQGEYILADTIKRHADQHAPALRQAYVGQFYGNFYSAVNTAALVIQALLVARLLKHGGVRLMLFVLPLVALGGYGAIAIAPVLAVVAGVKLAENALDYSLQNTARQALFLPTSREAKYGAKAAIDTTIVRLGDLLAAGVVFVGVHRLGLSRSGFAALNVLLAVAWTAAVVAIAQRHHGKVRIAAGAPRRWWHPSTTAASVVLLAGLALGCAGPAREARVFPGRPVAWQEHDDGHVAQPPADTGLVDLNVTIVLRDSLAGELDYYLTLEGGRPARDVNALDEVPCSTWFCARNHLRALSPAEAAAGPPGEPPRPPFRIVKGKARGAALGFQVIDAEGRKFLLKLDVAGHAGMASAAEVVSDRIFHAAGYNVPNSFVLDLDPETDLALDPHASFVLYDVQKRPLTAAHVREQLAAAARGPEGRIRAVAVTWLPGKILGAFDMIGRRADDPNDRIPHEQRRSLRASRLLFAWLAVLDAGSLNTLDSYVEERGRRFVRHYFIDFGAALGSSTTRAKGPQQTQEHIVEVGRSLAALAALGFYQRPYERQRDSWSRLAAAHREIGWFAAEEFDPDEYRSGLKVPAHRRMTDRDAYWGAKLVTSFSDQQIEAIVAQARLPASEQAYLTRALRIRRDIIGRRYLRAVTAIEAPRVADGGGALCFDDLAVARGYAGAGEVRYAVSIEDRAGRQLAAFSALPAAAATCLPVPPAGDGYRVVAVTTMLPGEGATIRRAKTARVHLAGTIVLGLERDD